MPTATKTTARPLLTKTQSAILKALVRSRATEEGSAIPMKELVRKLKVSKVMTHFAMGSVNPKNREKHDKARAEKEYPGYRSLLSRAYTKVVRHPDESFVRYYVTARGVEALS